MNETNYDEKTLQSKWAGIIGALKDGQCKKVRRDTVIIGVTKPFGTLTRNGCNISFEPARGFRGSPFTAPEEKAVEKLCDLELLSSFSA